MIKDLVSVIMPTTGRVDRALGCIQLLLSTTQDWPMEIDVAVDVDLESEEKIRHYLRHYDGENLARWRVAFCDHYQGKPMAWNTGLAVSAGEFVVFAADDLRWTPGWLEAAMSCMPPEGGLVGLNDLHRTFAMRRESTHYLATREFVVKHLNGCMGFPHYRGACNDSEACARARLAGMYHPCYEAVVEHVHWRAKDRPKDATDDLWAKDKKSSLQEFRRRQRMGFPNDFEPAITAESLELER